MYIVKDSTELNIKLKTVKLSEDSLKLAFIPTMGNLHQGHLELVKQAKAQADIIVVSIFINPKQFNNQADFINYPKTLDQDIKLLKELQVDFLFIPEAKQFYQQPFMTKVNLDNQYMHKLCAKSRVGHFEGVALVLIKLFNIILPDMVFFGQKDYQQAQLVKQLITDLNYNIKFNLINTIREKSGLALSSRNNNLSLIERNEIAPLIYKQLKSLQKSLLTEQDYHKEILLSKKRLEDYGFIVDYLEILNNDLTDYNGNIEDARIFVAVFLNEVRLIDNIALCITK